jgi:hypothetical protein
LLCKRIITATIDSDRGSEVVITTGRECRMLRRCRVFYSLRLCAFNRIAYDFFDASKPTMLAINNNIAAVIAINTAVIVSAIADLCFNN